LTPAKAFFEAHRKDTAKMGTATDSDSQRRQHAANVGDSEPHPERTDALLRSFGVFRRTAAAAESCDRFAHLVSQRVLTQWQQGREQDSAKPNSVSAAEMQLVQRLKLDADGIFVNMRALVELHLGADAKSFLSSWLAQRSAEQKSRDGSVLPWVDRIFSDNGGDGSQDHGWLLGQPATAIVEPLAKKLRAELRRWFVSRLDDPQQRLAGARRSLSTLESHLNGVDAKLQKLEHSLAIKVGRLSRGQEAASESGDTDADVPPAMKPLDYMQKRLDHLAAYVAGHTARLLLSDAKVCGEELISLGREFNQMAKNNAAQAAETNNADGSDPLAAWLTPRLDALAEEVDGRLANECLREQGLWTTVMQGGRRRAQLCARLNELSRQGVLRALGDVNVLDEFATSAANATTEMQSHLASATPALLAQGGARRILAIMPHDGNANSAAELSTRLNLNLNTMVGGDNNMTLCVEASGLTVCDVAVELVQRRRDRVDFAGRVQSRTDIQWTPLLVKTLDVPMSTWVDLANTPDMAEPYSAQTMVLE
jgi:hypothetical protein